MSTKRVSSFILRSFLPAALLCLIASVAVSCGHKHSSSGASDGTRGVGAPVAAPRAGRASASPTPGDKRSLDAILRDIDGYAPPSGVNAAQFAGLKAELKRLLQARSKDRKTVSVAPTGTDNAVSDLAAMSNQQGTNANVVWTEKLKGDYNNDGAVNIADLIPVALYYGQWTSGGSDGPQNLVDGDDSPFIDIGDLAAIAANYGSRVEGYQVWRGHWNGASVDWETTMRPNPNPEKPNLSAERPAVPPVNARPSYGYTDDIAAVADKTNVRYKVVPYGDGASGVESNIAALTGSGLADSPWPKIHGDVRNSGLSSAVGPQTNALKWNYQTGAWVRSSPAVGADGTVYVSNDASIVFAVNGSDGTLKWESQPASSGLALSSPAVAANGTVYVGCSHGNLYALNAGDGGVKWTYSTGNATVGDPTIGPDGTVYFGSGVNVCAVNPDGTLRWTYVSESGVAGTPAVGADGTVYALCTGGLGLLALNSADGSLRWQTEAYARSYTSPAIGSEGSIYVSSSYQESGLACMNAADGSVRWRSTAVGYPDASPAVGPDGTVYVTNGSTISAVDPATGTIRWTFYSATRASGTRSSPAVGEDGTVYAMDADGTLFALSPLDGSVKWTYTTRTSVESSPAVGADGSLYVGCSDGRLYAFGVGPKFSVSGMVTGPSGGLGGVSVTLTPGGMSATSLADGTYQIPSVPDGTYTVMPMKGGYTFSPLYPSITVSNADATQNFTATPGGLAAAPWPKLHGTAGNTGLSPYVGAQTSHIKWRKDFGGAMDASPVIDSDGVLYVSAGPTGVLQAIDARDGGVLWTNESVKAGEAPAIGIEGAIYAISRDTTCYLVALRPSDGAEMWRREVGDPAEAVAIGIDGTVLTEAGYIGGTLYALYPADGTTLWSQPVLMEWPSCPAVAADGTIYYAGVYVDSLDSMGNWKWSTLLGDSAHPDLALVSPSVGPSGDVYVKAVNNSSYELSVYALSGVDGSVKWKLSTGAGSTTTSMSVPGVGPDGTVYFGSEDHYIYAVNPADGSLKWKRLTGGKVLSSPAIGADNTVYIGSDDSNVYAINGADGSVKWVYATSSWLHSCPAIGADGTVYVMTHNGTLYAFGP